MPTPLGPTTPIRDRGPTTTLTPSSTMNAPWDRTMSVATRVAPGDGMDDRTYRDTVSAMRRFPIAAGAVLALVLAACGGGDADSGSPVATTQPTTTLSPPGACGLRPLGFTAERGRGSGLAGPGGVGVLWEQEYMFSNPNPVDVRLSSVVVELDLSGTDGHFFKSARSVFRPVPNDAIPAGRDQQRFAHAWLATGSSPTTDSLFATASATVSGAECPVSVERLSGTTPPAHVLALQNCDPQQVTSPC